MCGGKRLFLFFYMNKVSWIQIMGKTNHHYTNNVQQLLYVVGFRLR